MKVVHFIPSIDQASGGTTAYMQLLANELGKSVDLYILTAISLNPVEIKHATIKYIPTGWKQRRRMRTEWKRVLHQIHPDVVHVNCCWMPECAWAQLWAQQLGYKVVLTPHGMLEPWIMARHYWTKKVPALLLYQKKAVMKADYLHATANSEKENLLKLGYNKKIEVIANGIDVDKIEMKKDWTRKKKILFLSRIHVKKGIEFLIEAAHKLKNELQGYQIIIAGEGDANYIGQLKDKTTEYNVSNLFNFCGGIYGDAKWSLFREADLFILPTYSENFGIVVAEALACGAPVITTKGTPWSELETENCGWWTEIGTQATVKALKEFLQLPESALEIMGRSGRTLIEDKYSDKKMAENMIELYNRILQI